MRVILDLLEPRFLRSIFASIFGLLSEAGVIKEYRYWKEAVIVTVDGVEHFSSTKVSCPNCTTKTLRSGEVSYQQSALAAVIVHPERSAVLPLEFEPILKQDGEQKNDCARNAAKRLCLTLHETHPELSIFIGRRCFIRERAASQADHQLRVGLYSERQTGLAQKSFPAI